MKINTALIAPYITEGQQSRLDAIITESEATLASHTKDLPQFINEFCYAFNLRVAGASGRNVFINTPNGLPVGRLYIGETGPRYGAKERMFAFKSDIIIHRERALPGTHARDTRHAKTIRGMLQTVKKNDKPINEATVSAWYMEGLAHAIATPFDDYRHVSVPSVDVPKRCILPMVEAALGIDSYSVQQHKDVLQSVYDRYRTQNADRLEAEAIALRYGRGCTMIGLTNGAGGFYYVTQAKLVEDDKGKVDLASYPKAVLTAPLKRVETMPEEFFGIAAITKAYLQGKGDVQVSDTPFGMPWGMDKYLGDVDVVASYTSRMQWVIIPMEKDHV